MRYLSLPILLLTLPLILFVLSACSDEFDNDSSTAVALPTYTPLAPLPTYTPLAPLPTYTPLVPLPTYTPIPWRLDEDAEYYYRTADSFYQIGNYEKALDNISNALLLNPNDLIGYEFRARTHAELGNHLLAISDYTNALFLMPEYSYALEHINLSEKRRSIYINIGEAHFHNHRATLFLLRAEQYRKLDSLDAAINDLETSIRLFNRDDIDFYEMIFWSYKELFLIYEDEDSTFGDIDKAIYIAEEVEKRHSELLAQNISISEGSKNQIISIGALHSSMLPDNQIDEAIAILSNLISLYPYDDAGLYALRASHYGKQLISGEIDDKSLAINDIETCIELGDTDSGSCVDLAIIINYIED